MATSSVSTNRVTNLTGLIDIDSLVEANTLRQKQKINTATQKMKVEEYKQQQYREIQTKSKTFYNKYCDILSGNSLMSSSTYNTMKATSSDSSSVTASADSSAVAGNYKVNVTQVATSAQAEISLDDLNDISEISINGEKFQLDGADGKEKANDLIKKMSEKGIEVEAKSSDFANGGKGGLIIKTKSTGQDSSLNIEYKNSNGTEQKINKNGSDAKATITDVSTGIKYEHNSKDNSITLDGVTFEFKDKTDGDVNIGVKADGSALKDKLKDFINDYNELMGSINERLYQTRDSSYMPLTDDDKEGLTDSQIEKLEAKAQEGLLKNDSYLRNFADAMKSTMSTVNSKTGLSLEKIGINPVNDYTSQNGLFTIDEDALLAAIESNPDGVKDLFVGENGIMTNLKKNLEEHATGTFSRLAQKAGVASSVTATTNEMTKDIQQRKKAIEEMKTALTTKENNLYSRYSTLESNLSTLQSQLSSFTSYSS